MSATARGFLGTAEGRLLPVSIPFRYFGAAVVYHVLAWIALLAGAADVPRFAGGLGWPLAALHLVTLGVLAMTAIGASLQLLPVATLQPVRAKRWAAGIWWLYTPGVAALALGMGVPAPGMLAIGALAVVVALCVFAALFARNLWGAVGMPAVIAHGWIALISLLVVLTTACALAGAYVGVPLIARGTALALHVAFATYGFMGMLALGLSYILVPMFALSAAPDARRALVSCALAAAALSLAAIAASGVAPATLRAVAIALGAAAVALYLHQMLTALRTGIRRELGNAFRLVRIAWAMLVASLALALAMTFDVPIDGTAMLFGLTLIGGWLLSFVLGILQRIVPFLASLHAVRGAGRRPTPTTLTATRPLAIHFACHCVALALLFISVMVPVADIVRIAAATGTTGAIAFTIFFAIVLRRMTHAGGARKASAPAPIA
ncbi:MAG: hypothetical protein IT521_03555 [Burkholderiales bacterium]|nr:hypothetical protein [Burkholderiales bacterium]